MKLLITEVFNELIQTMAVAATANI